MTFKEAYKIIRSEILFKKFSYCIEYEEYFVFFRDREVLEPGVAVNKKTAKVITMYPSLISLDEIRKGGKKYSIE